MPKVTTGKDVKVICHTLEIEDIMAFCLKQVNKGLAHFAEQIETMGAVSEKQVKGIGGECAHNSPDTGEPEASTSVLSPLV